jgi:GntR family transcriptional regulator, transcriptional repressor for pyruvate dehydrogenase complex
MFKAAKQNRIFQDVVDQIEDAIISGQLQQGDTLPSERDLKELFQTSRGTLREALRVLEQKGLIEIKLGVGGGSVVKAAPMEQVCDSLDLLVRFQQISLQHLAEFREGIEGIVAATAARRATQQDINELETLIEQARDYAHQGVDQWRKFVKIDKQIHQALAQVTGNPMYIVIHQMVHDNIQRYYEQFLPWTAAMLQENFEDLRGIVAFIKNKDTHKASALARSHVQRFSGYMMNNEMEECARAEDP